MKRAFLFLILFGTFHAVAAQQMVVMKRGSILARYNLGEEIRFVLKGGDQVHHTAILQIREFEFITLQKDTIEYADISKLKFKNKGLKKYVTSTLIASASLMALHLALKEPFGDTNPQAVNGLAYVAVGGLIPVAFAIAFNKSTIRLNGFKRLKFVNYDSPLYK